MTDAHDLRALFASRPVDVTRATPYAGPVNSDRVKVYRRHNCKARHRTAKTFLRCAIPRAAWVHGEGEYATVAWCNQPTVLLCPTFEEAQAAKAGIDSTACGGRCQRAPRNHPGAVAVTTAAPEQLALVVDPLDDDVPAAARLAIELRVADDDARRSRYATWAPACRCPNPWGDLHNGICGRCGRTVRP